MRYYIYISLIAVLSVLCFNNATGQGISPFGANRAQDTSKTKGQIVATAYANPNPAMFVRFDSKGHMIMAIPAGSVGGLVDSVTMSNDSLFYWGGGVSFFVGIVNSGGSIDTTGLSDRIAYNLTRIDGLSDTASNLYDTAQVHEGRIATLESEVANIPIVDSTRYVLYTDSNTVYVTPTQLDEAIADIPPLDTSNIVARIDSNANSIDYLDSTAYVGKPVNVQRVMIEGQSNCNGSDVDTGSLKIPPLVENQFELLDTFERVYTWDYTNNVYKKLKAGVTNYGRTTNSFGSELSFAARWEKNNPDGILVIDKKCLYGQTIDMFQKGSVQYTTILDDRPLADEWLKDRGYRVKNTAWIYIQGESDYLSAGYEYLAELNQLVSDKMSDGLIDSTTRIVISQVSTSAPLYGPGVDSAQVAFVNAAPNRKLINNDANTIGVGNHYDAAGYVQLGLSAYAQAFDADSLKTLDEFMHQPGIGTVIGEVRIENVEGDAAAAQTAVGAPAAFTVVGDNTTKYPFIVGSKTSAAVNSNLMWFVAGGQPIGTVFAAAAPALLIRAVSGTSLGLGANNRNADITIQSATGNVGVGVGINPVSKFDVLGSIRGRDTIFALGNIYGNGLPRGKQDSVIYKGANGRFYIGAGYVDSVKKSNDSFFYYKGTVRTFIGLDNSGSGSADSTTFFTNYRADTMRANIYGAISASGLVWGDTNILGTKYDIDTVNAKIPDVSGFISWTDTVSDIGTKHDVDTLATSIYGAGYLPASTAASTYVSLSGSYSNPTWITDLAWSKITGTPTTLAGYSISDAQPLDADLTAIAGLSPTNDDILQRKAGSWTNRTMAQLKIDLGLVKADVGLSNVDNTADASKNVATAAALTTARTINGVSFNGTANISLPVHWQGKTAGETDTLTTGVKLTFRFPCNATLTDIKGAVNVASSSGNVVMDVKKNGTTIMSTNKITIEATETSSRTATTPPGLTTTSVTEDDIFTVEYTSVGTNAIGGELTIEYEPN